jgi:hypothetical protein
MNLKIKMALLLCAALGYPPRSHAQSGSTNWLQTLDYDLWANDSDRAGNIIVPAPIERTLRKFDSSGQLLWSIQDPNPNFLYFNVAVAKDSGAFYVLGINSCMNCGFVVVRFAADGTDRTIVEVTGDTSPRNTAAVDDVGEIWAVTDWFARALIYHRADGSRWSLSGGGLYTFDVAFDPDGNVIIGGSVNGRTIWEGQEIGVDGARTPLVLKYDRDRQFLWLVQLPGLDGDVFSVRTSALGTVVAAGAFNGETTFGSDILSHPPGGNLWGTMLLTIEPDGTPRWARQLAEERLQLPYEIPRIAVDPPGRVAVAYNLPDCGGKRVEYWNLAGDPLWSRSFAPVDCQGSVQFYGVSISNGDVVLSGAMRGTVDFGTGEISGPKGVLLELSQ